MVPISAVLVYLALSVIVGGIGRKRSIGFPGFFVLSVLLSPILMAIVLLVTLPKDRATRKGRVGRVY